MPQIVLIITIIIIVSSIRKHRRNRPKQKQLVRVVQSVPVPTGADFQKLIKAEQKELEKLKKADQARAERIRTAKQKAGTAYNDMAHYKQQQTDYLRLYNYYDRIANDPDIADKKKIAAYTRCINLDNKIRTINRNIEQAQNKLDNYNRLVKS